VRESYRDRGHAPQKCIGVELVPLSRVTFDWLPGSLHCVQQKALHSGRDDSRAIRDF
jgi:hypothetical protein